MKIDREAILVSEGDFSTSETFQIIDSQLRKAINAVTWESQSDFVINPTRKGNGVLPIKSNFVNHLVKNGWIAEEPFKIVHDTNPGKIDAVLKTEIGDVAVEWETGNVSSSHRALNKMALGLIQGNLIAGFLILPVRNLAKYLTDRIGNFEEISPYFPLYGSLKISRGYLKVIGIVHDSISSDAMIIPKGLDGNAFRQKLGG